MERFRVSVAVSVSLLVASIALPAALAAQGSLAAVKIDPPTLVESFELVADPRSDVVLPSMELRVWSDGTRSVVGTVEADLDAPPFAFDYVADLEAGTYRTTLRSLPAAASNPGTVTLSSERFPGERKRLLGAPGAELQGMPGAATYSYSASGTVRTEDPPTLDLTKTTSVLDWTVTNGVTFNWTRTVDRCAAANPSALGTHWFIEWCTNDGGYYKYGDAPVCNRTEGKYYNDDFLDNSKRTHVQQWVETCGGNGFARFTWSHSDWGEAAGFLSGKFSSP